MKNYIRIAICFALFSQVSMPSLYAAVGGWYLLVPPIGEYDEKAEYLRGFNILEEKQLSQWIQQSAYDSAVACEAARTDEIIQAQGLHSRANETYLGALRADSSASVLYVHRLFAERYNARVFAFMSSRCIKSDDSRLRR